MEKTILTCAVFMLLVFAGCSEDSIENEYLQEDVPGLQLKGYSSGTHDGFFWFLWTDDRSGSVNYSNGSGGNYSVSWNYSGNFTCGKGWSYGDYSRVIGYNVGAHSHTGGGSIAYYGWTRNPLIEYYVNERWGNSRPTGEYRGAVTFANHVNAWASVGLNLGNDWSPYAILLTEAYGGSQGYANVTVWNAGSSTGGGNNGGGGTQYYRIQNRATGLYIDGMGVTNNGGDLGQYANTNHQNAHWIREASGGYERFKNRATGLYIDGMGRTNNGDNAGQYANTTHVNAQWSLEAAGDGYYRLRNRGTGMYLDGYGRTTSGSAVSQYANTTHPNAQWRFVPVL
jgi:hypothetical protein